MRWGKKNIMLEVGFEPTHPKIIELKSTALDRSAIQAYLLRQQRDSNPRGLTPTRFRIWRLNHSAMLSYIYLPLIFSQRKNVRICTQTPSYGLFITEHKV